MRIEIDFQSPQSLRPFYRGLLLALPILVVAVAFWFWSGPILETLSPFAVAFVLAYLVNPLIDWVSGENRKRFRVHRALAILLFYLAVALALPAFFAALAPAVIRESSDFAEKVRRSYAPALRDEIQPHVEKWILPASLISNGDFTEWEGRIPKGWQLGPDAKAEPLLSPSKGLLLSAGEPHPNGKDRWTLLQTISGLVAEETYTLSMKVAPVIGEASHWRFRLFAPGESGKADKEIAAGDVPLQGRLRTDLLIPPGMAKAVLAFEPQPDGSQAPLRLLSVRLAKPPFFPFFQFDYWAGLYQSKRHLLTWSNFSTLLAYGTRGAGMVAGGAGGAWTWLAGRAGGLISLVVYWVFLLVILFYMLLDFAAFKRSCLDLVPLKMRARFLGFMVELDRQLGGFLRGQATVCLCVGLMASLFMLVLRVPFAIPIGLAAGLFNAIPYLGPTMGMTPAVALTLLEFFDPESSYRWVFLKLGLVVGSFLLVQIIDGLFISPKVMAKSVDVSPLVVIGALMLGGGIGGILGMVLAIPVYCVLRVLAQEFRTEWSRSGEEIKAQ
jgi:predicted PurR-regulated permease PerM